MIFIIFLIKVAQYNEKLTFDQVRKILIHIRQS